MNRSLRILLLEEDDADARLVTNSLREAGLKAQYGHARNREDLLGLLDQSPWDVLLSDCQAGGMAISEVLEVIRQRRLSLPVIAVCRDDDGALAASVMHAGAHDFVRKQALSRLTPAIERELAERAQHQRDRKALHKTEQQFRQLSENIQEVFWLLDAKGRRMLYLSPSFEDVWERPAEKLLASPQYLLETIHPDDAVAIQQVLDEQGWLGLNHDYRILLPDGTIRWIHTRAFSLPGEPDGSTRIAGISNDITGQKCLEQEKEMMVRALEQSADTVIITDDQGVIVYVNSTFEDICGYTRQEVIGKTPSLLRSGFQNKDFYRGLWQSLSSGLPFSDVFINRRKDGELFYEAKTITPLRDNQGRITHYVATGKDITGRLKVQKRLQHLLHYDAVTGMASRLLLQERLHQGVLHARRRNALLGVIWLDLGCSGLLDGATGQELYEQMIRLAAQRLEEGLEGNTTIARMHGDEFVILQNDLEFSEQMEMVVERLMKAFSQPLLMDGYELFLSPVAGISLCPEHAEEAEALLTHAELAMQHARHHGVGGYLYYQSEMSPITVKPRTC